MLNRVGVLNFFVKSFGRGLFAWTVIAVAIALWKFAVAPLALVTGSSLWQAILTPLAILATGILGTLASAWLKRAKQLIVREILPASLTEKKVVEWEMNSTTARGLLLSHDGVTAEVMEIMGGPMSITWFPRKLPLAHLTEVKDEHAMDFILHIVTLGLSKTL